MNEWKHIMTAPKNYKTVLLYTYNPSNDSDWIVSAYWSITHDRWVSSHESEDLSSDFHPTHWADIPKAPPKTPYPYADYDIGHFKHE